MKKKAVYFLQIIFLLGIFFIFSAQAQAINENVSGGSMTGIPATTPTSTVTAASGTGAGLVPCGRSGQPACTLCHFIIGFQGLINFGMKIVVYLAMTMIFISGVLYILVFTDEGLVKRAKDMLTGTLVGFAFVVLGWLIINVTLWVLSANVSMGQSTTSKWYEIKCDPTSNFPTTTAGSTATATPSATAK